MLSITRKDFVPVLLYHRVNKGEEDFSFISSVRVSVKNFEKQIEYISQEFKAIHLRDIYNYILHGKKLPKNAIAITFDDGYKDNYTYAFPILKHYGIPATFFLITGYINSRKIPWWDRLFYFILKSKKEFFSANIKEKMRFCIRTNKERQKVASYLLSLFQLFRPEEIEKFLERLANELEIDSKIDLTSSLFLNWEEIEEMKNYGMDFGTHTCNHINLSLISNKKDFEYQVVNSAKLIEDKIKLPGNLFSYPYNIAPEEIKPLLKESGFLCACAGENPKSSKGNRFLEMPRISIFDEPPYMISLRVSGVVNFIERKVINFMKAMKFN